MPISIPRLLLKIVNPAVWSGDDPDNDTQATVLIPDSATATIERGIFIAACNGVIGIKPTNPQDGVAVTLNFPNGTNPTSTSTPLTTADQARTDSSSFDDMGVLTGDDLLIGPRGRVLCMAVAHRLDDRVWSAWLDAARYLGDTARLNALVRVLAAVDVQLEGIWQDPVAFLEPVADAVSDAMYWEPPHDEDAIAAIPTVRAALRPLASAIAAAPATAWWNTPVTLGALRYTSWFDDHRSSSPGPPALSGAASSLLKWRERTVAENLAAGTGRPPRPGVQYSGTWWSAPTLASLVSTTRPVAGLGAIELAWHEDSLGFQEALIWSLETVRPPKVWEIDQPQAWVELAQTYPLDVTDERRDDWQRTTGREGAWSIPDWNAVATEWDAVHVSVAGYLTTATRALPLSDGNAATMLAGWNPDQTWWLTDILRSTTTEPERWHSTEDLNWHRLPP